MLLHCKKKKEKANFRKDQFDQPICDIFFNTLDINRVPASNSLYFLSKEQTSLQRHDQKIKIKMRFFF